VLVRAGSAKITVFAHDPIPCSRERTTMRVRANKHLRNVAFSKVSTEGRLEKEILPQTRCKQKKERGFRLGKHHKGGKVMRGHRGTDDEVREVRC
jgi:hypothetical protein